MLRNVCFSMFTLLRVLEHVFGVHSKRKQSCFKNRHEALN